MQTQPLPLGDQAPPAGAPAALPPPSLPLGQTGDLSALPDFWPLSYSSRNRKKFKIKKAHI